MSSPSHNLTFWGMPLDPYPNKVLARHWKALSIFLLPSSSVYFSLRPVEQEGEARPHIVMEGFIVLRANLIADSSIDPILTSEPNCRTNYLC